MNIFLFFKNTHCSTEIEKTFGFDSLISNFKPAITMNALLFSILLNKYEFSFYLFFTPRECVSYMEAI